MERATKAAKQVRNKAYEATHRTMIETAVRLMSEKGIEALSIAELARHMGIDRTTVYYHFKNRDDLLDAVSGWATEQLARGMDLSISEQDRAEQISRFVLENPSLIKLWIDGFVSGNDIRDSYTRWDELVEGVRTHFSRAFPEQKVDAEIYCVMMLCAAIIGPRVYANSVRPDATVDTILQRFLREERRMFERDGLLPALPQCSNEADATG